MKKILLLAVGLGCCTATFAQSAKPLLVAPETDIKALEELERTYSLQYHLNLQKGIDAAAKMGLPAEWKLPQGGNAQVAGINPDGTPLILVTDNRKEAKTTKADRVWYASGRNSYNLSGRKVNVAVWDGGTSRLTHRELRGRLNIVDGTATTDISDHATHVAGTIAALGVDTNARGMAGEATIRVAKSDNDETEMAAQARLNLNVSNHSYGALAGWYPSGPGGTYQWFGDDAISVEYDWKFGFYGDRARSWDQIALAAPYYLICKSAGNFRGDGPGNSTHLDNGPYDCITDAGMAKNILTVAAVANITVSTGYVRSTDVVMSSFSSWGPTDDGRIKPDVSAVGVRVYSSVGTADNDYDTYDGTSMSTPNTVGVCVLLQELYQNLHQTPMRSTMLKNLLIHTAEEAGPTNAPGPDYRFGWGLINAERAASFIVADSLRGTLLEDKVLGNHATDMIHVTVGPTGKLKASIVWLDAAGTVSAASLNDRTPKLVRDLDLRLKNMGGTVVGYPWHLVPDSVTKVAQRNSDNFRDNVEVVEASGLAPGTYMLEVTHKGTLPGSGQAYSLIVSGLENNTAVACRPNMLYRASKGTVADGSGRNAVADNADCVWTIDLSGITGLLRLDFDTLDLQSGDTLYVRKQYGAFETLAKFSAGSLPTSLSADSGLVSLRLVTDGSTPSGGFSARYSILPRPSGTFSVSPTLACTGDAITLTFIPTGDTTGYRFNWLVPGFPAGTYTQPTVRVPFTTPGVKDITLVITNAAGPVSVVKPGSVTVRSAIPNLQYPYKESFESPTFPVVQSGDFDSTWVIEGSYGASHLTWARTTQASTDGVASMRVNSNAAGAAVVRSLITPTFHVRGAAPYLKYDLAFAPRFPTAYSDKLVVYRSSNCGQSWTVMRTYTATSNPKLQTTAAPVVAAFIPAAADWRHDSITLAPYATVNTLMFKFELTSYTGNFIYLDNMRIDVITGLNDELQSTKASLYPNPGSHSLTLSMPSAKASSATVRLMNAAGQVIAHQAMALSAEGKADLSSLTAHLPRGFYSVEATAGTQSARLTWVKE